MMRKSVISNIFAALLTLLLIGIFCDLNAQPRPLQLLHGDVTCDAQGNSQQNGWLRFDYSGDRDNYSWYWLKNGRIFQGRQDAITNLDWGDVYHLIVSATDCGKIIYEEEYVMGLDCGNSDPLEIRVEVKQPYACLDNYDIYVTPIVTGGKPPYTLSRQAFVIPGSTLTPGKYTGVFDVFDADFNTASATYNFFVVESASAVDPNEITGPIGYDSLKMVNTFDKMRYQINFENDPDFATASANRVSINYDIPANQKVNSFRLSDFGFGNFTFTVPSNATSYYKRFNLQEDLGIWLDVTAGLDITNRKAFWIFQTIDPETGYAPADSRNGFLAINDSLGSGEGFVNFTISPADNLHTGDTVSAIASIIFDDNAAIETNVWTNTFDAVAPQSTIFVQRNNDDSLRCTFITTAHDDANGSGVQFVEIFVSENGEDYYSIGHFTPDSSYQYSISEGVNYSFYTQATDNVNNIEIFHTSPDAVLDLSSAPTDIALQGGYFRENDPIGTVVGTLTSEDANTHQNFEYYLVDGEGNDDNNDFYIQDNILYTNNIFSCNGQYTYNVRIMTTNQNGYSFEKAFEIPMLRENYPQTKTIRKDLCANNSYFFKGQYITESGTYTDTLASRYGCDSIVILKLNVLDSPDQIFEESICQGEEYHGHGFDVPADSTMTPRTLVLTNTGYCLLTGCDSTTTLQLTINAPIHTTMYQTACESYEWNDTTYTQSGDYTYEHLDDNGCTQVDTLHLTINNPVHLATTVVECGSYEWNDTTYTQSGDYTYTHLDANGCTQVDTLHLTINNPVHIATTVAECGSYEWNDTTYTQSGDYTYTHLDANGCTQVDTLHLTINNPVHLAETIVECESYEWNDSTYTQSGDYTYTHQDANGCTQVDTLHLTINNPVHLATTVIECGSYEWNDTTYTQSGDYTYEHQDANGCTQVDTLHLTINPIITINLTDAICQGNEYHNHGFNLPADSTMTPGMLILTNYGSVTATGCDSTTTLQLTINPTVSVNLTDEICQGSEYHNHGFNVPSDSTMTSGVLILTNHNTITATGCDSTTTLQLTVNPNISITITDDICQGSEYFAHGFYIPADSTMTPHVITMTHLANSELTGCDSTTILQLSVHPLPIVVITGDTIITLGESVTLTASGAQDYIWNTGDNTASIIVAPTISSIYSVIGSTEYNCQGTDSIKVYVSDGITSYQYDAVQLYPNPTHHHIEIDLSDEIVLKQAVIYDAIGRQVYVNTTQHAQNHLSVAVDTWSNGMYFVHLHTSKGLIIKKFVKE